MNEKRDGDSKKEGDDEPGFRINLPFGLGWLRGDGTHLALLMPVIKWIVFCSTAVYLGMRIVQEFRP